MLHVAQTASTSKAIRGFSIAPRLLCGGSYWIDINLRVFVYTNVFFSFEKTLIFIGIKFLQWRITTPLVDEINTCYTISKIQDVRFKTYFGLIIWNVQTNNSVILGFSYVEVLLISNLLSSLTSTLHARIMWSNIAFLFHEEENLN